MFIAYTGLRQFTRWGAALKVLFVFYVPSGGVETLNRERAIALKDAGIAAHLLYFQKGKGAKAIQGVPCFITNSDEEIQAILSREQYTAIVVVSAYPFLQTVRQFGYKGIVIFEVQGLGPPTQSRNTLEHAQPYIFLYANALMNPKTPHIEELFQEMFPNVQKFSFNNCMDTNHFTYKSLPKRSYPIIAWLGRIEPNKNWEEFLEIGAKLSHLYPNMKLWMFEDHTLSEPAERQRFNEHIDKLGLRDRLIIRSNVPRKQMSHYFSIIGDSGGFLCSTSVSEGAPYSILEALSCRCPILTTDSGGVRSAIIHNQTGKYYPIGQISKAVQEAKSLIEDVSLRQFIREHGQKRVQNLFSQEAYRTQFATMIQTLKQNHHPNC